MSRDASRLFGTPPPPPQPQHPPDAPIRQFHITFAEVLDNPRRVFKRSTKSVADVSDSRSNTGDDPFVDGPDSSANTADNNDFIRKLTRSQSCNDESWSQLTPMERFHGRPLSPESFETPATSSEGPLNASPCDPDFVRAHRISRSRDSGYKSFPSPLQPTTEYAEGSAGPSSVVSSLAHDPTQIFKPAASDCLLFPYPRPLSELSFDGTVKYRGHIHRPVHLGDQDPANLLKDGYTRNAPELLNQFNADFKISQNRYPGRFVLFVGNLTADYTDCELIVLLRHIFGQFDQRATLTIQKQFDQHTIKPIALVQLTTQYALECSLRYLPDFLLGGRRIRLAPSHATRTLRLRWLDRTTGQTRTPTLHEITLGTRHFGALESVVPDPPAGLARVTFECYGVYEAFKISLQKGGTNFCLASPPPPCRPRPRQAGPFSPRRS